MSASAPARLPSLRRRLAAVGLALTTAVLAAMAAMLLSGAATHTLVEDSRAVTVPRILERQRATANLERLIRFGWIAATAQDSHDWRQAVITAQALAFHPSLAIDEDMRRHVVQVHATLRQVVALRERAQTLRATPATADQAARTERAARDLWTPQEALLVGMQGKLADDAATLVVERFEQVAEISDQTRRAAIAVAIAILLVVAVAAWIVWRQLLAPVSRVAQTLRHTLDGTATPDLPPAASAEIGVMQDAVGQLRDALHRASQREHALRASEQRLASIFDASEAAIALTDAAGQVMQANRSLLRLLGRADALDLHPDEFTFGEDRAKEARLMERMRQGEIDSYRLDKRLIRGDGSIVWVDASVRAIHADTDATAKPGRGRHPPHQFVTVAIDISDRVRVEKELRFIRALVDQSADPIYCVDPLDRGRMVWSNAAACRHFGHTESRLLTMRIVDWDPNFDEDAVTELWKAPELFSTRVLETSHRVAGGDLVPVEVSATWLEHDGRPYVAGYIRDIRDRNRMLEAVRRSNEDLQQFAYVASHDLQEPLRMVASFLQLLERRYGERLDQSGREYIQFAVDGAVRMKKLIEDLLAFSRIDCPETTPGPVSLEQAARDACHNLSAAIAETGGAVSWENPLPTVPGDQIQLTRVLQNLIGNALKYRHPQRPPQIRLSAARRGDTWVMSVRDNGIGIAAEYHDRIFMIFQRLHGIGQFEGTGIGLAICKRIVERHGGEIWVESRENIGSTFHFSLPARLDTAIP